MKYSKVVRLNGKMFRYNYTDCVIEWISKAEHWMLDDNDRWQARFGKDLWEIVSGGYVVNSTVGLSKANWDDASARKEYLQGWCDELEEEVLI